MVSVPTKVDSNNGLLIRTAEKRIPCEIKSHFNNMLIYRYLRDGVKSNNSSNSSNNNSSGDMCVIPTHKRHRDIEYRREVSLESCTSRVLSCLPCQVLTGYCVMWVESAVCVSTFDPLTAYTKRRGHEEENAYKNNNDNPNHNNNNNNNLKKGRGRDEKGSEYHNVRLFSLHIVDQRAYQHPMQYSFALQSLCQPGRPLQLQCYPYHMVHFGLLMHAIWNAPDVFFEKDKRESFNKIKHHTTIESNTDLLNTTTITTNTTNNITTTTSRGFPLMTNVSNDGVLLLGLGGNVIGNCLDVALSSDVPIDVVEIEPTVLEICRAHNQLPLCEVQDQREDNKQRQEWIVSQAHHRYPHYRFILTDARTFLQDTNKYYSLIFLDCYDPSRERMMHDCNLIDLCHARLIPGGAVIVNAHILPTRETLEEQFLSRGFATVQVLRVAGCDQCIVVCLAHDKKTLSNQDVVKEEMEINGKWNHFSVRHARFLARRLFDISTRCDNISREGFCLDAGWLKSSRCLEGLSHHTRVWEHYE
ncbi:uncharacterized protein TM35_000242530 [Trypanosoma theileri]|uniref:Spermidine synthase n=1 Tax=Trypanosoma theileri TaxID=67003 RepID=A0A1X0NRJ3_9TRYP|nr:uncharacterized protein TM35_000242530 [Trypanosoma theileri]ORC87103.1 hypothetical protein TM35_000242530 [Trypanosoma theileri]